MILKAKFKKDGKMFTVSNKKLEISASDKTLKKAVAQFVGIVEDQLGERYNGMPSRLLYKFEEISDNTIELDINLAVLKEYLSAK